VANIIKQYLDFLEHTETVSDHFFHSSEATAGRCAPEPAVQYSDVGMVESSKRLRSRKTNTQVVRWSMTLIMKTSLGWLH